jgi:hypothetical protein
MDDAQHIVGFGRRSIPLENRLHVLGGNRRFAAGKQSLARFSRASANWGRIRMLSSHAAQALAASLCKSRAMPRLFQALNRSPSIARQRSKA